MANYTIRYEMLGHVMRHVRKKQNRCTRTETLETYLRLLKKTTLVVKFLIVTSESFYRDTD